MDFLYKQFDHFYKKQNGRKCFLKNEIFFSSFYIMKQTRFSKNLTYFHFRGRFKNNFLTKIKNYCILTGNHRSVNSKLKISHINISRQIDSGSLIGFYRSL